jgi:ubiquinone/menaquinone biosynthesis C-methylase UbiE
MLKNKHVIIICFSILVLFFFYGIFKNPSNSRAIEHFNSGNKINKKIYDKFYAGIYDQLFYSRLKTEYEMVQIHELSLKNWRKNPVKVLDAGCGTGQHITVLNRYKYPVIGIDRSPYMLKKAQNKNPKNKFVLGDFSKKKHFKSQEFSHIMCLFFTIYYQKDLRTVFKTFNYWLKPSGVLVLHLVNRQKFDPVLERSSSLIPFFNPQKNTKTRKLDTSLTFNKFKYNSTWIFDDNNKKNIKFVEKFTNKKDTDNTFRQHIHQFNLITMKKVVKEAKRQGFHLFKIVDLLVANHDFNYLYFFEKKYGN